MEYQDYETGKSISREQYIKNGLERGELLVKEDCGCVVIQDRTAEAYIVYCYKHEVAPRLYEALKFLLDCLSMPTDEWVKQYGAGITQKQACDKARQVIAEVEK